MCVCITVEIETRKISRIMHGFQFKNMNKTILIRALIENCLHDKEPQDKIIISKSKYEGTRLFYGETDEQMST